MLDLFYFAPNIKLIVSGYIIHILYIVCSEVKNRDGKYLYKVQLFCQIAFISSVICQISFIRIPSFIEYHHVLVCKDLPWQFVHFNSILRNFHFQFQLKMWQKHKINSSLEFSSINLKNKQI